jgi:hypothetical protein
MWVTTIELARFLNEVGLFRNLELSIQFISVVHLLDKLNSSFLVQKQNVASTSSSFVQAVRIMSE